MVRLIAVGAGKIPDTGETRSAEVRDLVDRVRSQPPAEEPIVPDPLT